MDEFDDIPPQRARETDPITAKIAAALVDAPQRCREVYECIRSFGLVGCIGEQVVERIGKPSPCVYPSFRPMERRGLIVRDGKQRKSKCGRPQLVIIAAEFCPETTKPPRKAKRVAGAAQPRLL